MVRERLYDAACLILSPSDAGRSGAFSEPCGELTFANLAESLVARAIAYSRTQKWTTATWDACRPTTACTWPATAGFARFRRQVMRSV